MKFNEERPFGIEIEAVGLSGPTVAHELFERGIDVRYEGYTHHTTDHWKVVTDGSVHGTGGSFELVSPKLYGEAGLEKVKQVMQILREIGVSVNSTCGLHVHHSAQGLSGKQSRMVAHAYSYYYEAFRGIFPRSRQNNGYCRLTGYEVYRQMQDRDIQHSGRTAVNLLAILRHGTIEFRQHQGSLNGSKAVAWIVFTQQFMANVLRIKKFSARRREIKQLRRGLFSFFGLYEKEPLSETCAAALKHVASKNGWKVGRMLAARNGNGVPAPQVHTYTSAGGPSNLMDPNFCDDHPPLDDLPSEDPITFEAFVDYARMNRGCACRDCVERDIVRLTCQLTGAI